MALAYNPPLGAAWGVSQDAQGYELRRSRLWNVSTTLTAAVASGTPPDGMVGYRTSAAAKRIVFYDTTIAADVEVPRKDYAESITATWSFSPGAGVPPFATPAVLPSTGSTATMVTNLNANYLRGYLEDGAAATASTIALRDASGRVKVEDPSASKDAVNLGFMQTYYSGTAGRLVKFGPAGITLVDSIVSESSQTLTLNGGASTIATATSNLTLSPASQLFVLLPGSGVVVMRDNATDATTKTLLFCTGHYTNSEEPFLLVHGTSTTSTNVLSLGGGSATGNWATTINFHTVANNTTTAGDYRWQITSAGILQSFGAQTIQTATGHLTLATAAGNGNIVLSNHGTGLVQVDSVTASSMVGTNSSKRLVAVTIGAGLTYDSGSTTLSSTGMQLDVKDPARVATTANLAATYAAGVLTATSNGSINGSGIDGVTTLAVNDRILVKDQSTPAHNGIYSLTTIGDGSNPFVLTRTTDADTAAEVTEGMYCFVEAGTTNINSGWIQILVVATLGTDAITWKLFSRAGTFTAGNGMVLSGAAFHFSQSSSYTTGAIFYATGGSTVAPTGALTGILKGNGSSAPTAVTGTANIVAKWGTAGETLTTSAITDAGAGTVAVASLLTVTSATSGTLALNYTGTGTYVWTTYQISGVGKWTIGSTSADDSFRLIVPSSLTVLTVLPSGNIGLNATSFGTSAAKVVAVGAGTAPTTSPADTVQAWVEDMTGAGTASLYVRSESGSRFGLGSRSAVGTLEIAGVVTDATSKAGAVGVAHYTNAEEPTLIVAGSNTSGGNAVLIGGGSAQFNTATAIGFYTAATTTTTTGTLRMSIDSTGVVTIAGLSTNRIISTVSGALTSVSTLTAWVAGTSNQVVVGDDGDGSITLSLPQSIATGSSPTFAGITLTGLTGILQGRGATAVNAITGTTNTLPKWSATAPYLADSNIADTGTVITLAVDTVMLGGVLVLGNASVQGTLSVTNTIQASTLTNSRLVASNGSATLVSVSALTSWIAGTANQVTVTDDGDGTVTLSLPQGVATGSSPTFTGITLTGLTGMLRGNGASPVTAVTGTSGRIAKWSSTTLIGDSIIAESGQVLTITGGASTITTTTAGLTISTGAANGNIGLVPHGTGMVGVGTSTPTAAMIHVVTEGAGIAIVTTASADGATFDLWRNDASPAPGDRLGEFHFYGNDSTGAKVQQCAIYAETRDHTAGIVSGRLMMNVTGDGSLLPFFQCDGDNRRLDWFQGFGSPIAFDMRIQATAASDAFYFKGVGGTGYVGINTVPSYRLHVLGATVTNQTDAVLRVYSSTTKGLWFGYNVANTVGLIGACTDGSSHDNISIATFGGNVGIGMVSVLNVPLATLAVGGNVAIGSSYKGFAAPTSGAIIEGNVGVGSSSPVSALDLGSGLLGRALTWGGSSGTAHYASIGTTHTVGALAIARGLKLSTSVSDQIEESLTGAMAVSLIKLATDGAIEFYMSDSAARTAGTVYNQSTNLRWAVTSTGAWRSTGAQTITTTTGNLTISTSGGGGSIILAPNGAGYIYGGNISATPNTSSIADGAYFGTTTAATLGGVGLVGAQTATATAVASLEFHNSGQATSRTAIIALITGASSAQAGAIGVYTHNGTSLAERWRFVESGVLQAVGAQTITTTTGALTLTTGAADGNVVVTPNGAGILSVSSAMTVTGAVTLSNLDVSKLVQTNASRVLVSSNDLPAGTTVASGTIVTGSGTVGTLALWTSTSVLGTSVVTQGGSDVTITLPLKLTNISTSRLVYNTAGGVLDEVSTLTSWVAQTANQVLVADDGDGSITLSLPQNIHTGASPTFTGLSLTGLTNTRVVFTSGGALSDDDDFTWASNSLTLTNSTSGIATNIQLRNLSTSALTDNGTSAAFYLARTADATARLAGLITVQKTVEWTSTASTNNSQLRFHISIAGSSTEAFNLVPDGKHNIFSNGVGTTFAGGSLSLYNGTDAAAGAQQYSPALILRGSGWKTNSTAGSQPVEFGIATVPVQGAATPSGYLSFQSRINSGSWTELWRMWDTALTDNRLMSRASGAFNTTVLSAWVSGTTNQVTVTDNGSGGVTLSTPQNIHTAATPTFAGMTLNGNLTINAQRITIDNGGNTLLIDNLSGATYFTYNATSVFAFDSTTVAFQSNIDVKLATLSGTTATSGFLVLPRMAGTPTGVPSYTASACYDTSANKLWVYNAGWQALQVGSGAGTVTSVAMTVPTQFAVSGSPVTTSGTLAVSWNNQSANTILAGPGSGAAAAPTFRTMVPADVAASSASGSTLIVSGSSLTWLAGGTNRKILQMDASLPSWQTGNDYIQTAVSGSSTTYSIPAASSDGVWITVKDDSVADWAGVTLRVQIPGSGETVKPYYLVIAKLGLWMYNAGAGSEFDFSVRLYNSTGSATLDMHDINFTITADTNGETFGQTLVGVVQATGSTQNIDVQVKLGVASPNPKFYQSTPVGADSLASTRIIAVKLL